MDAKQDNGLQSEGLSVQGNRDSDSDRSIYNMNYKNIGQCVIINNKAFDAKTGMVFRNGSDVDAYLLWHTFQRLGYDIKIFNDLTAAQIVEELTKVSQEDHSQSASFVCVLLSHGEEGVLYGTDGPVELRTLTGLFRGDRCATLVGKPKLFFIQVDRGTELDSGVAEMDSIAEKSPTLIPVEADFLYSYSSPPGYNAWRNTEKGSWFIQSLCHMLATYGKQLEIMQIMTRVNCMVARDFQSCNKLPDYDGKKQMPCIMSTLTKELLPFPNYKNIGQCVIINNKQFDAKTGMSFRKGSDVDAGLVKQTFETLGYTIKIFNDLRALKLIINYGMVFRTGSDEDGCLLKHTFQRLGYDINIFNNLTAAQIVEELTKVSQEDHSQSASFVCVLLSHGEEGVLYGTDGPVELRTLTGLFRGDRCATLVGKPKLFFIQADRGTELDSGVTEMDNIADESPTKIPVEADFLYAHSTVPGYHAWRNTEMGSWFIQSLCHMLATCGKQLEIMQIMMRVNCMVARDFESCSEIAGYDGKKQIPCIMSTLTKELYFTC